MLLRSPLGFLVIRRRDQKPSASDNLCLDNATESVDGRKRAAFTLFAGKRLSNNNKLQSVDLKLKVTIPVEDGDPRFIEFSYYKFPLPPKQVLGN